ncbi:MAG TPA: oligosaccharide flippase family protein [Syntrophomonadaceae bacterium]|nr:oligosaccharide flippase family protein [Syntrophomonadaceae bacterium]
MSSPNPSAFATDVFKLVTGTTFAQLIVVLASPLLTRLYGPEAFGFLTIFTSISSILGVIACMRYELAIMLPKTDEEAANLLGLCLLCVAVVSGLTIPALYIGGDALVSLLGAPGLAPYLTLIPPFVFINGVFLALNYWNSRTRHFGRLSVARVTSTFATIGTQLGAGFAGYATGGSLIGANLVGVSISTGALGGQIWRDDRVLLCRSISRQGMISGLKRYKKFPLIDSSSALLNTVSWQLPAFLLAAFFSPAVVGFYALGFRMLQLPMSLIGSSIAQVFFQRASEARSDGTLPLLVENVFRVLVVIGIFPVLTVTIVGPELFAVIFGDVWVEAGLYAQILSIWAFVWFISSPLSTIWIVLEKQEFGIRVTLLNFITRIISLVLGGISGSPVVALLLFAMSGFFVYGYLNVKLMVLSGVKLAVTLGHAFSALRLFCPSGIILIGLKWIDADPLLLFISTCILGFSYYLYVINTNSDLKKVVSGLI